MKRLLLFLVVSLFLCFGVVLAQEPPEPTGPGDIVYGVDEDTGVEITIDNGVTWIPIHITYVGPVTVPVAQQKHKHFNFAGMVVNWLIQVNPDYPEECLHISIDDNELTGVIVYRLRARIFIYEPDGTKGMESPFSEKSWWVYRFRFPVGWLMFNVRL